MKDEFRKPGVIESVKHYFEDHVGQWTSYVFVKYDDYGTQGFGGYGQGREEDDPLNRAYVRELCETFGVKRFDDLVGKRCVALFEEKGYNAYSRGLEDEETGKRFTVRGWLIRNLPSYKDVSTYETKMKDLDRDVRRAEETLRRIREERDNLRPSDVRDWVD